MGERRADYNRHRRPNDEYLRRQERQERLRRQPYSQEEWRDNPRSAARAAENRRIYQQKMQFIY